MEAHDAAISVKDNAEEDSYDGDSQLELPDGALDENAQPGEEITRDDFFVPDTNSASTM